jgi:hexosaminidase
VKAFGVQLLSTSSLLVFLFLIQLPTMLADSAPAVPLMPLPAHVITGEGMYVIDRNFNVALAGYSDPRLLLARKRFLATLFRETGILFRSEPQANRACFTVLTAGAGNPVQHFDEDESYRLAVNPDHVQLTANTPLGALHGLQTFLQLVRITPKGFAVPSITIDDQPRFPWRGLMLDVSRHFIPVQVIERNLDGMEAVKLNVLHWHLSDDQGFRVESRLFPLLQEKASDGHFYTQEQVKEVVEYARERGIRVVPEFEMPCHVSAWLAAYPNLASGPGPYQIETHWGIFHPSMDPTRESTYQFLDQLLGEMTPLFPDAYFHIGGDECDGKEWDGNPRILEFKRAHGLKDNDALQAWFTSRVQKLVAGHQKTMEGWDEVLQPDAPRDVLIHSWRGPTGVAAAARHGNPTILSNGYYIDLNHSAAEHYLVDPLDGDGASLSVEQKKLVLGGEATMWSEFVTPDNIDSRIWPRTAAIAERLWSPQEVRDVDSMYARLDLISQKLEYYGLQHKSFTGMMLTRMSGEANPRALKVLAEAVQPPVGYAREELKEYDNTTPLNRLVDSIPPESNATREFESLVKAIVSGKASPEQWDCARRLLLLWRDNDAVLQPRLNDSELTSELVPVSHTLSLVAAIGLQAIDNLQTHHVYESTELQKNLEALKAAEKPQAILRLMVVSPVEDLVRAAGAQ